jgi:hypothetical protein
MLYRDANACDHDIPGPVAPAGETTRSSCCTFDNRIGTRPASAPTLFVLPLSLQTFMRARPNSIFLMRTRLLALHLFYTQIHATSKIDMHRIGDAMRSSCCAAFVV